MPVPLPQRRIPHSINNSTNIWKFSDYLKATDKELELNRSHNMHIDDFELLKNNFDFFQKMIASRKISLVSSKDYDCIKYIYDNIDIPNNFQLSLCDDGENKDRSYIELERFKKCPLIIPYVYSLWIPEINSSPYIYGTNHISNFHPTTIQNYEKLSLENLKIIKEIICKLNDKYKTHDDLEKTILLSNYIQSMVQYVDENNRSECCNKIYITDSQGEIVDNRVHTPDTVLLGHYGICEGIANATTILSNNPVFNLNVRTVRGSGHVWNIILIDGKYYYIDNTWNITRNPNQFFESLKAIDFCSDYLLFGKKKADKIGHHISESYHPLIEEEDYQPELIKQKLQTLSEDNSFSNYPLPVFKSRILR